MSKPVRMADIIIVILIVAVMACFAACFFWKPQYESGASSCLQALLATLSIVVGAKFGSETPQGTQPGLKADTGAAGPVGATGPEGKP